MVLFYQLGLLVEPYHGTVQANRIHLPRGVVIPWEIEWQIWNIRVRRANGDLTGDLPKYSSSRGSANGMYNIDLLEPGDVAVMTEGEFDAQLLNRYFNEMGL